jgi:hypothetical protein
MNEKIEELYAEAKQATKKGTREIMAKAQNK